MGKCKGCSAKTQIITELDAENSSLKDQCHAAWAEAEIKIENRDKRIKELEGKVERAYIEGFENGYDTESPCVLYDQPNMTLAIKQAWYESDARMELKESEVV